MFNSDKILFFDVFYWFVLESCWTYPATRGPSQRWAARKPPLFYMFCRCFYKKCHKFDKNWYFYYISGPRDLSRWIERILDIKCEQVNAQNHHANASKVQIRKKSANHMKIRWNQSTNQSINQSINKWIN